jgi:uncharacterized membrane protein
MPHVRKSVTILQPRELLYQFWRDFENLPRFMQHLEHVEDQGGGRSHWVAKAPAGRTVEWNAEIVDDKPNELIVWRSLPGSDVKNSGRVHFSDAPGDRGTEITVDIQYDAPGGALGVAIAKLFAEEPGQQLTDDLRRFKQVVETGEVVLSDGSQEGAGQGATKQRPAQPISAAEQAGEARP